MGSRRSRRCVSRQARLVERCVPLPPRGSVASPGCELRPWVPGRAALRPCRAGRAGTAACRLRSPRAAGLRPTLAPQQLRTDLPGARRSLGDGGRRAALGALLQRRVGESGLRCARRGPGRGGQDRLPDDRLRDIRHRRHWAGRRQRRRGMGTRLPPVFKLDTAWTRVGNELYLHATGVLAHPRQTRWRKRRRLAAG